jgi:hypothetical protein
MLTLKVATRPTLEQSLPKEFNGLPVVRAPKELNRRGLTNQNIIIHPSGIKLSKCPNGYIILCTEDGCGSIGSKPDVKCVKHAESYRICRYPGCGKRPHYGLEKKKPLYCAPHRPDGLIDVVHNVCLADGCNLLAYFGIRNGIAEYCSNHKSPEMIDVLHKRCIFPGCDKIPSFGVEGGPVQYCSGHKPEDTVDVKHKRCIAPGCNLCQSFGFPGEKAQYCDTHKLNGMINVKVKRCLAPDCMVVPSFDVPGGTAKYCKLHKSDDMVNVKDKRCKYPGCMITPCYGFKTIGVEYCNQHKQDGMTNIRNKRCIFPNCTVRARYGVLNREVLYCSEHKLVDMVNLRDKKCAFPNCDLRPSYNSLFSRGNIHCRRHATLNEYTSSKCNPICYELECRNPATYIDENDTTIFPKRCTEHKHITDIELVYRICPNCEEFIYFPTNQQHCMDCGKYRELVIISVRETTVEYLLQTNDIQYIHNKRISPGGSRHRPDFLIPSNFGFIIIEVDENQHNKHFHHDEEKRMKTIYNDTQLLLPGKQVLFLRYNPDKFYGKCDVDDKQRLAYLFTVLTSVKQSESIGIPLGYVKLFYDGFDGSPVIQPLNF